MNFPNKFYGSLLKSLSILRGTLIASTLLIYGCGNHQDSNEVKEKTLQDSNSSAIGAESERRNVSTTLSISATRKIDLSSDQSNLEEFKENINNHQIIFNAISGHYQGANVECKKKHFDAKNLIYKSSFDNVGLKAVVQVSLDSDDPSEVNFDCSIQIDGSEIEYGEVKIYKSYVVSKETIFQTAIAGPRIGTLLIDKEGTLITNGANLDLKINELISFDGKIATFEKDKIASDNRPGYPGGHMKIEVEKSQGKITFELRGMHGGAQKQFAKKMTDIPPPGKNGVCYGQQDSNNQICFGKPGLQGFKGNKGFNGLPGGNAGTLELIFERDQIQFEVKHYPGKGSQGGPGGEGGEGSKGGLGAYVEWNEPNDNRGTCPRCSVAETNSKQIKYRYQFPHGADGAKGPKGDDGETGEDGKNLNSKIIFKKPEMELNFNYNWKNFNEKTL